MIPGLPGRYTAVRKIASGGMSEVYLCRLRGEAGFEKKVAVKVVAPRLTEHPRFRELFVREARIAASLSHQNLVQVFDFGRRGNAFYLAMEFVDGWNLAQTVAQVRVRSMPVPLGVWRHWVVGMLDGLAYLHARNVIHRDVSPSNILLSRAGAVKITDFGIAWAIHGGGANPTERGGKFSYMSPEQARGGQADVSSDLFSAAVVAAELFLPGRLFDGGSPDEVRTRLHRYRADGLPADRFPAAVRSLLMKNLSHDPAQRHSDAGAFAEAIGAVVPETASRADLASFWDLLFPGAAHGDDDTVVLDTAPTGASMVGERREPYGLLHRRGARLGAGAVLVAASIGGILLWKGGGPPPPNARPTAAQALAAPETGGRTAATRAAPTGAGAVHRNGAGGERAGVGNVPRSTPESSRPAQDTGSRKRKSTIRIETDPDGVSVEIDGRVLGTTPLLLDAATLRGTTVAFRKEGYAAREVPAHALAQLPSFRLALSRLTGTVEVVQAIPWAKVYEADQYLGVTPIPSLRLPAGVHRLRFVNRPLGVDRVETVTILPGANPKLIVRLVGER